MADQSSIEITREFIGELDDSRGWSDARIGMFLDRADGSVNRAAASIWTAKASHWAHLVDTTESGSTRRLGALIDNARKMADSFTKTAVDEEAGGSVGGPFTVAITRG
jgi:hypothetical protein